MNIIICIRAVENTDTSENTEQSGKRNFVKNVYDWADSMAFAVIAVVIVFTFFLRIMGVNGDSMLPTLENGNYVLISDLFYTPEQGDVVVITPTASFSLPIIKRVIATQGQTVDIDFTKGEVYVDNMVVDEPYIAEPTILREDMTFPQTVPEGHLFVMGDNRNNSLDSRSKSIGMVDTRYILGKAFLRVKPISKFGEVK